MHNLKTSFWLCQNCDNHNPQTSFTCEVCGEDMPLEQRPPIIKSLVSAKNKVNDNEFVTITWSTENAKYVSLNGVRVSANGSKEILATSVVNLKAYNPNGKTEKSVTLVVTHKLVLSSFHVNRKSVRYGEKCKLSWDAHNLKDVIFQDKNYGGISSLSFIPLFNKDYSITFVGVDNSTLKRDFSIEIVYPEPSISITTPEYGVEGKDVEISWKAENISKLYIDGNLLPDDGKYRWHYHVGATKKIEYYDLGGSQYTKEVTIREAKSPHIAFCELSADKLNFGKECKLTWLGNYVTKWYINKDSLYSYKEKNITFKAEKENIDVHFIGENGEEEVCHLSLTILHEPYIKKCVITTDTPRKGVPCVIEWESEFVESVVINKKSYSAIGSYTFKPQKNKDIHIEFIGQNGVVIHKELSVILPPVQIEYLSVSPQKLKKGDSCNINWYAKNTDYVQIKDKNYNSRDSLDMVANKPEDVLVLFYGSDGTKQTRQIHLDVEMPKSVIHKISCSSTRVKRGEKVSLSWDSSNVQSVNISVVGTKQPPKGKIDVSIDKDTNICFTFNGEDGTCTNKYIKIQTIPAVNIRKFNIDKKAIKVGESCEITWAADNVSSVIVHGKTFPSSSTYKFFPKESETINVLFNGEDGTAHYRSESITVSKNNGCVGGCLKAFAWIIASILVFIAALFSLALIF